MVLLLSITSHLWGECICIIRKHVMAVVNDLISSGCSPPSYARVNWYHYSVPSRKP